ncbi:S-layer homology domain-containing protein [Heyndrickxia oleronia]|jgi:hypothetical protein|uniref:S-layer homology domain-containing protein n=1 Tax=Heyndrickxia oleronia TaxID=38875 RepID=UPI00242E7617|nr:S-layer homology domain-containing protein [Heyndrickxia oleronia]MCI1589183.1 S-layer homology domain-containing protein [Heyndrickxia oleronia]MCI1611714.1 S-layer homology domain-containing protein [Heyndrickxia oleronia]MCI1743280.1 S-layer homology domain-containing protein [Heyndrickxia oleronia]MCI1760218.1 S-layer homology domain-containing protein [Heyndrickxia oleronia]
MSYQPKSYNKFLAGAATAAVVASAVVPVATHAAEKKLTDVKEGSYYAEAVNALAEAGVIKGYEDGTFRPNNQVTRAEVAKIIAVQLGLDTENAGTANYSDAKGHWANTGGYLAAVAKAGIMKGDGNGTFRPNAPLTRAEMASIVVRAYDLQAKEGFESQFKDLNAGGAWAADAIKTLEANGYANGIAKGQFGSASNVKRADVAVFLFRVAKGEAAPTVESVSAINNIEVNEGAETVNLPKEVEVKLSNGEKAQKALEWDKKGLDLNKPGEYTLTGDVADTDLTASVKVVVKAVDPEVTSVSSINATQVEVKFNKAVDAKTLFTDGVSGSFKSGVVSIRSIDSVTDGTLTGELSQDGKVLTVTSTQLFEKRYDVVVDKVKTTAGSDVEKFSKIISIDKDVTAPSIIGTERITANQVKIKFSEPMASAGSTTFKLSDGTTVSNITGHGSLVDGGKAVVLDLSSTSVPVNKDITATIIGAADKAGNLLNPNPATVTFQKGDKDGVAPTVSSVTQTGAKTFEIVFSEAIVGKPAVSIDNTPVAATNVVIDSKDATKVKVTATDVLDGDKIITITDAVDGSGEVQAATNRVVKFVKDAAAPVLVSSAVVADETDKAEYLEFTFDKDVNLSSATVDATGSYVKNHVTTSIGADDITAKTVDYKDVTKSKKVIRVKLATLLGNKSVEGAQYSLDLAFSGVTSDAAVAITTGKATFTRGTDGTLTNTDVVALAANNAIVQSPTDNSTLVVTFDKAVDAATATNTANYIVGGAVVESATVNATDLTKVTLKLKADSNTFSGVRNVTVQNVKAAGSTVAMTTTTKAVDLKENVAPTVTAQLQADLKTIKLTFSENVYQAANTSVDFGVFVGTDAYKWDNDNDASTPEVAFEKDSGLGATTATAANTVTIELPSTVTATQLNKGLSLKALSTIDITDVAGNKLSVPANITISNN